MALPTLTSCQRDVFAERGLLKLHGLLPADLVAAARDAVLRTVSRSQAGAELLRDGEWRLNGMARDGGVGAGSALVKGAKRLRALRDVFNPALVEAIRALLGGERLTTLTDWPSLLFTLPNAHAWTVPRSMWHVDLPRLPSSDVPGIQAFAFLDDVPPGGGGTLVVTGSHRLVNDRGFVRSRQVKRTLKGERWFRELLGDRDDRRRFMRPGGRVRDVDVQVAELHGKAGDVALTDLRLLHTLAPNACATPRMMATQRYLREQASAEFQRIYSEPGASGRESAVLAADARAARYAGAQSNVRPEVKWSKEPCSD